MKSGYIYAILAYLAWGLLPVYWKLFQQVGAWEILSQRIVWSVVFILIVAFLSKKGKQIKEILADRSKWLSLTISSLLISINWIIYIWSVNNGHMIEASLGYYMNPLVSVLLGVLFLRERLKGLQWTAMALAASGVLILTISYGQFPWIALSLAVSFGLYGLAKKKIKVDPTVGLTLETLIVLPLALIYT